MSKILLAWTDPTTYDDGKTPLTIANIEVFGGVVGQPGSLLGNVGPGVQQFTTDDLPPGQYNFNVVVQDGATPQQESDPSNIALATIAAPPVPRPAAVINLTATVVADAAPAPTPDPTPTPAP